MDANVFCSSVNPYKTPKANPLIISEQQPFAKRMRLSGKAREETITIANTNHPFHGYEILLKVGQGSFSKVYKSKFIVDGITTIRALKKIECDFYDKKTLLNYSRRELRALKTLRGESPYLIHLYGSFVFDKTRYFSLEFVPMNLERYLAQNGLHISLDTKISLLKQILHGISCIHTHEITHGDLKPENIGINPLTQEIKILDFGTALFSDDIDQIIEITTIYYRAPEVILEQMPYTSAIDLWAFGCLAFEILTGSLLFQARNEVGLFNKIIQLKGKFPHEFVRRSPRSISKYQDLLCKSVFKHQEPKTETEDFFALRNGKLQLFNFKSPTKKPSEATKQRKAIQENLTQIVQRSIEYQPSRRPQASNLVTKIIDIQNRHTLLCSLNCR